MNDIITLLKPRIWSARNRGRSKHQRGVSLKFLLLGGIGAIFWGGIFAVSLRVISYFESIRGVGDIIAYKLLSMIIITSFALLIFSNILTSLSKLYLSRDLPLVHSMPVPAYKIFTARWADSTVESSWMVIIYTIPVFISYGIVYGGGPLFYATLIMVLLSLSIIASAMSALLVMLAVMLIPASRLKSIFLFLWLTLFMILYIAFRFLKPELLVDPDVFISTVGYLQNLQTPSPPYLPTTWAFDSIKDMLAGNVSGGLLHIALSWACAGGLGILAIIISDAFYFKGLSKTQTAPARLFSTRTNGRSVFNFLSGPVRAFVVKEIKTFFRDQTQWSQLFLIAALIVIYVYNFKVLPLEKSPIRTVYLQNLFSFLNMGLALFVLTAITARFAFPAVSAEKDAFWIVETAPIPLKTFLWIKFFIYYLPLLVLSEILIVVTNIFLQVTPMMMWISSVSVFFLVPGVIAMGIGFGAAYPDFKAENPVQTVSSFGGLLFMIVCAGYIGLVIIIEAGPVYNLFMASIRGKPLDAIGWIWISLSFGLAFVISILGIVLPMRFGVSKLSNRFQ